MEIKTKEKRKYTYLKRNVDTKIAIYFEEKTEKFYTYKLEPIDGNWGFVSMFLAPIAVTLSNIFINNIVISYFLACLIGIILGLIFMVYLHKAYSSTQLCEIELTNKEIDLCVKNLKKISWIKILLVTTWLLSYMIISDSFFETRSYQSLLCISILFVLAILLLTNLNFIQNYRIKKILILKLNENKENK